MFGLWCTIAPTQSYEQRLTYEHELIMAYVECVREAAFLMDDRKADVRSIALAIEPICAEIRISAKYETYHGAPIDPNDPFMLDKDIEFVERVVVTMRDLPHGLPPHWCCRH